MFHYRIVPVQRQTSGPDRPGTQNVVLTVNRKVFFGSFSV